MAGAMATLHVRGVPDDLMAALQDRAARNERTVSAELRVILSTVFRTASARSVDGVVEMPEPVPPCEHAWKSRGGTVSGVKVEECSKCGARR